MIRDVKPNRSGRILLSALIAVFVLGASAAVWLWTRPATLPRPEQGQMVAESFLKEIREGRGDAAWNSTTAEFKSALGRESFVRQAKAIPALQKPLQFVSVQTVAVQEQPRSEFLFRSSEGPEVRLVLGREDSVWKIDRWMIPK